MTVQEVIQKSEKVKKIYFRSLRNGEICQQYNDISEIDKRIISLATPGYREIGGRLFIDMF